MKIIVALFVLLCALGSEAQTNTNLCFRYPARVIGGARVDLSYLFSHWHSETNAVTNTAWIRLTGTVVGNSAGWIVDGETDSAVKIKTRQRVLVLNPPTTEKATFENTSAELDAVNVQMSKIREEAGSYDGQLRNGMRVSVRAQETSRSGTDEPPILVVGKKSDDLQRRIDAISKRAAELHQVMESIPHTNMLSGRIYKVDFFVVSTGKIFNGMPVLDFGIPSR
jgi:hypothetical protein